MPIAFLRCCCRAVNYDKPRVFGMGSRECKDLPPSVQVRGVALPPNHCCCPHWHAHGHVREPAQVLSLLLRSAAPRFTRLQVRHRCECKDRDVCGPEHDAIIKVLATTGVPSNYVLSPSGALVSGVGDVADLMKEVGSARAIGEPYRPGAVQGMLS